MEHKDIDLMVDIIEDQMKQNGISRRDAIKLAGLGGAAFLLNPQESQAATSAIASSATGKIVIVGGGLAGVATAAKLSNSLSNPDITIIEPNPQSVSYQPGQTLIGAGVWTKDDITYNTADYMPSSVKWIQDSVTEFNPDANKVKTAKNGEISYDYLVVAAGLVLDYGQIEGLDGVITSAGDNSSVKKVVNPNNDICSIYFADGAVDTWETMQKFVEKAKSGKKVQGIFTHPNTPIKCGGAPKKIQYLTDARLREAGARDNATLSFYPNGGAMFGVKEYHEAILAQYKARDFKWHYKHNLIAVDPAKKIATFKHHFLVKGKWDPDFEEYEMIPQEKLVEVPYDMLHITPPMRAPDAVKNSPLAWQKGSASKGGWIELKKETLQHTRYPNVFALGDVAGIPMGKTGGSARKQYNVLCQNLISHMEGKPLSAQYGGYTVCPLITSIGTVMLAEFDWSAKPTPSFPLDPTQERWIWWLLKAYALKPMTVYGMLSGRA